MKKILLVGAMVLVLTGSILLGQEAPKSYAYEFKGGVGDFTFTGVTFDQVWAVLVKTFMTQDKTKHGSWNSSPVDLDRPSGSMVGAWLGGHGLTKVEWRFEILVEQRTDGVGVFCIAAVPGLASKKQQAKIEIIFFDKVAELLYGKVEK